MLYHLLAGHMPYVPKGAVLNNYAVWALVQRGPPDPVHELAPGVPAELAAICEKAMARDFRARYPDTKALADDLRAFLERRVVRAYQTGAVAELRKWIERNRALAASLAAAILFLLAGAGAVAWIQDRARARVEIARTNEKLRADEAQKNLDDVNRLSDLKTLRDLVAEADTLWPAWSENVPRMQAWLERARALSARLPLHEASLARLRERALPFDESMVDAAIEADPELARRRDDLAHIETSARAHLMRHQQESVEEAVEREKLKPQGDNETDPDSIFEGHRSRLQEGADRAAKHMRRLHESVRARHRWRFDDEADQWWHDALATLVEDLHALSSAAGTPGSISEIEARIRHADGLTRQSVGEHAKAWREAIQSIASNAAYRGLELVQQPGLVPLEPDPASGLWEFWHVETGERPQRDSATGRWRMTDDVGIVFVLLPGGTFRMGCDPPGDGRTLGSPNVDPMSRIEEQPSHEMTLGPFLLSEYEWTRGQWRRATGRDPTEMVFGPGAWKTPLAAPVVNVSFNDCSSVLRRLGFEIPTEAQWEYAARAGSTTVFWCGDEPSSLATAANLGDRTFASSQNALHPEEPWSDGFGDLAPVGLLEPNRFGLHDVAGNVFEMCSDIFMSSSYGFFARNPDGRRIAMELLDVAEGSSCVVRGGSWFDTAMLARSAARFPRNCGDHAIVLGVRPARKLRQ
jgi:formylglycine-generating enzyme required for sulfatase activity